MEVLDKDIVNEEIVPYLSTNKRGFSPLVPIVQIVQAVLYKLKTGCQWAYVPVNEFVTEHGYSWQSIYYHYNKWSKDGSWQKVWTNVLERNKDILDLSSVQLDGSHTPAKKGGDDVGFQGRKKCKTTNMIFLSDNAGNMLAFSPPCSGNHHDLYDIKKSVQEILAQLQASKICIRGLFLNADAGFDSIETKQILVQNDIFPNIDKNRRNGKAEEESLPLYVFDEILYSSRFVIERSNAWLDVLTILNRFTVKSRNWKALHYIVLTVRLLWKKFK